MSVCMIDQVGVVTQRWDDVASLEELEAKYGLTGPDYVVASASPGMIKVDSNFVPPQRQNIVPQIVPKLALVRAMRKTAMDGLPAGEGQATIWDSVKAAIAGVGGAVEEDWNLAVQMPRNDPALNGLAAVLVSDAATRAAMLDALFVLADQIDRGEVAP